MQTSFVMLVFLLFSDPISGGGQTASGAESQVFSSHIIGLQLQEMKKYLKYFIRAYIALKAQT